MYDADFDYCIEICINRTNGRIRQRHHFENNENIKLPMGLGNKLKYETEIWNLKVIYDADFDYATEIRINCQT